MTGAPPPSLVQRIRRALLGAPIASSKAHHEKLSPLLGLPVFSSDALSSVAYATEAILAVLVLHAVADLKFQIWISLAIVVLIAMITVSYRQTIKAYPGGGGSYIVASDNLGPRAGLVAGAALLIDYILTVSVSVAAGVDSILSALPQLKHTIPDAPIVLSLFFILLVAFANLRGMRESGKLFAIPTYGFILSMFTVIIWGVIHLAQSPAGPVQVLAPKAGHEAGYLLGFIILRAFAAGCTALTGIEAVSDGVAAFKDPGPKNASKTLLIMSVLLTLLFMGMGYIALHLPEHYPGFRIVDSSDPRYLTLIAQIAAFGFGLNSIPFYTVLGFTAAILILAANTAFADFPRLCSFLARDGYMPRYMARQGDKLVFHNGIVLLAASAAGLIVIFGGKLDALLPLYAVGVFTAFTLSQAGMVMHWWKEREQGWERRAAVNAVGSFLCFIVLLIIAVTKFAEGAWLVMLLIPLVYCLFTSIKKRYKHMGDQLTTITEPEVDGGHIALLLVPRVHRGVLGALSYAKKLQGDIQAVHVTINEKALPELQRKWDQHGQGVDLVVLPSPYRSLIQPVLDYVDQIREDRPNVLITVIVAEAVSNKWYQKLLQENVAQQLKIGLARRKKVVVANTRYFLN